jgi:alpha-mannosidase
LPGKEPCQPFIEISDNAELTCCRREGKTIVLRLYETKGNKGNISCILSEKISSCLITDALGGNRRKCDYDGNRINIPANPFEIITLSVTISK